MANIYSSKEYVFRLDREHWIEVQDASIKGPVVSGLIVNSDEVQAKNQMFVLPVRLFMRALTPESLEFLKKETPIRVNFKLTAKRVSLTDGSKVIRPFIEILDSSRIIIGINS